MDPNTLFLCALLASAAPEVGADHGGQNAIGRAGSWTEEEQAERNRHPEIVVTGVRIRGAAAGAIPPVRQLDPAEIGSYGAHDIGALVDALAPQTRGNGGGPQRQIVLLNGNRIADFSEISGLPVEAVERVDILPEEVALSYGYPVGSRVLNVVLRERFRAAATENAVAQATEGGRSSLASDSSFTRIRGDTRTSVSLSFGRDDALFESERHLIAPGFRTLLPEARRLELNASVSGTALPRVTATLSGRLSGNESESRFGSSSAAGVIERDARSTSGRLAATLAGDSGLWRWSGIATAERASFSYDDSNPGGVGGSLGHIGFRNQLAAVNFSATGPVAHVPAGDLLASLSASGEFAGFSSSAIGPAFSAQHIRLHRDTMGISGSLDVPLTARGRTPAVGDVAFNLNFALRDMSRFGLQRTFGFALRWAPVPVFSLTASYVDDDGAPTLQELGEPVLATPNVLIFDPVRGETVEVTRLEGGNPLLRANNRRERKIEALIRPLQVPNLLLSVNYSEVDLRNPIATFPIVSPVLETAFPDRFQRDAGGRLLLVDARSITVADSRFRGLRWGLQYSVQSRSGPPRRLQFSIYDTWRFRNTIRTSAGGPALDLLEGSSVGIRGGLPRHFIEAQATLLTGSIGIRTDATWQDATVARAGGPGTAGADDLFYSSHGRISLRIFANLGQSNALSGLPAWLRNGRLTVIVDNLFGSRPRVRDARGATPLGYQPAYLDPLGRAIRISLRAAWF